MILSTGTGGAITGVGRKILEKKPDTRIVGVDPYGSLLAQPPEINKTDVTTYKVEGIGYDFIPRVLDRSVVTDWVKTSDKESLLLARRLVAEEGLLCGGSSGATLLGALEWAKNNNLTENDRIVVVLADNIRNYLTKHLSKEWMIEVGFIPYEELSEPTHPLNSRPLDALNLPTIQPFSESATVGDCLAYFQ